MRLRFPRPRSLSTWLLLGLALMLLPQFAGAAAGISAQQREISESRDAGRSDAKRLVLAARVHASVDAAQSALLRASGREDTSVVPDVQAALRRAQSDLAAMRRLRRPGPTAQAAERELASLAPTVARLGGSRADARALKTGLDRLEVTSGRLAGDVVTTMDAHEAQARAGQRAQLFGILLAFAITLVITLFVARRLVASIRRPLAELRSSARRLGSGDLGHRVELESFAEFNQVADSFNAMGERLRQSRDELSHRAFHDSLTGLANRELLSDRIDHALERRSEGGHRPSIGVLLIDVDDFKSVNDSMGHSRGDEVIVEIGRRIGGVLRPRDTVARLGGDGFAVLVDELAEPQAAMRVAERILLVLSSPVTVTDAQVELAASVGVAVSTDQSEDADELMRAADLAMYAAKDAGKGGYRVFDPAMLSGAVERIALQRELKLAVERGEIELHYQPIVGLKDGRVSGVEGLARWTHPERGPVAPDVFIPLAEQSGLIVSLGRQLLRRACADLPALRAGLGEPELVVGVNLSAAELLESGLPEFLLRTFADAGMSADSLLLEVTESQLMSDLDAGVARLHELTALGIHLALDDFGTGYSSLAYLRSFPVDALKVDKTFIDNVAQAGSDDHALVRSIISLGKTLELSVIAEGIEHEDQRRELERLGCDRGQGYLFARPMPVAELVAGFAPLAA